MYNTTKLRSLLSLDRHAHLLNPSNIARPTSGSCIPFLSAWGIWLAIMASWQLKQNKLIGTGRGHTCSLFFVLFCCSKEMSK